MKNSARDAYSLDITNEESYTKFSRRATDVTLIPQHDILVRSARAARNMERKTHTAEKVTDQTKIVVVEEA